MKYDFETIPNRHNMDALAVDSIGSGWGPDAPLDGFDAIPMWVADMNFVCLPDIVDALIKRASHPSFGYFEKRHEYYDSIIKWHKVRYGVKGLAPKNIGYQNGVLGGVVSILNALISKGDSVLINSPTYIGFTHAVLDAGYKIVLSELVSDGEKLTYNLADMEKKIMENNIKIAIICNPHNPAGRCWTKEELESVNLLFKKYNVLVISDEIWADINLFGNKHVPYQSVSSDAKMRCIALYAPSKTFNIAGLIGSYHVIYNEELNRLVSKESASTCYDNINVLSMHASIAAYYNGATWVDELCSVLSENVEYAYNFIINNFKGVKLYKPEATYMLFIDCEDYLKEHNMTLVELVKKGWDVGVAWQNGEPFHGKYSIRINLASPKSQIEKAFNRLKEYVFLP